MSTCRSCGTEVLWLTNQNTGRRAPIDAAPSPEGNIVVDEERGVYRIVPRESWALFPERHLNHFVTCPQAKKWAEEKGIRRKAKR